MMASRSLTVGKVNLLQRLWLGFFRELIAIFNTFNLKGQYLLAEFAIKALALQNVTVESSVGNYKVKLLLGDVVQRQIYFGLYEKEEIDFVLSLIQPGDVVLDVGANIGFYSLNIAPVVGARGRVHAFEPIPHNFEKLSDAVATNRIANITINEVAVGNKQDSLTLHYGNIADTGNSGGSSVAPNEQLPYNITVPVITLDDYIEKHQIEKVRFIKMDIEGAEALALEGMCKLLSGEDAPDLLLELSPYRLSQQGKNSLSVTKVLADHGYTLYRFGSEAPLDPYIAQNAGNLYCTKHPG